MKLTANNLVRAIGQLPKNRAYDYVNLRTKIKIKIDEVIEPEGPIYIRRYNPSKAVGLREAKKESISTQMLWRVANAISPNHPVNIDRILGASYNTRSVLEALLAHTPEFYYCFPGRIEVIHSSTKIKHGHKHLMWSPDKPHGQGRMVRTESDVVISEIPSSDAVYEALILPDKTSEESIDIEVKRRHAQIQIALLMIGKQLDFRTWIAKNDKGIIYKEKRLGEMEGVIVSLDDERLLASYSDAIRAALLIDCIWFRNHKFMPAVLEIEHSTGVTSGLSRMKNFQDALPPFKTRWVIVAPDEDRDKVIREANKPQFHSLETQFFPYLAAEELYSLCTKRKLKGVNDDFLDCFMEPCRN
ncbi:Putative type II restriction enzyme NmeDIP (Endonuclease NmeDIP) (R.NmeDIP) [hydrothermal vent metagenome]|uniref:Type II restriction enzyme NmeDIP (Endonuclease NmeDIP) (R.NmeDIP) n=1 Tax=hydrothermal vent metagenome TaxID=652676 RepID=A0A3B0QKG5_9ZZZZ